ncbi:MAG: ferritin-like domain-containing protein [Betaproteobacteria bacterium]
MTCIRSHALALIVLHDADEKASALSHWPASLALDTQACWSEPRGLPGRPDKPRLLPPREVPQRAVGSAEGRAGLIHALAHIECNAMDLALDVIWRFPGLPEAFYRDWLQVAREEALHFSLLHQHLQSMGYGYGDFDAHEGLWDMARRTQDDLLARLAVVPRILEARGLDASPAVAHKLRSAGDRRGAEIVELILRDEINHVAIGNHWFGWLCAQRNLDPLAQQSVLAQHYGAPRPRGPFNLKARSAAGFTPQELAQLER